VSAEQQTRLAAEPAIKIRHTDLRFKWFTRKNGSLFILLIDTSGSMAFNRINQAKVTALGILRESYVNRDSIAIVAFRGASSDIALPPSRSMVRARRVLDSLRIGGGTPLTAGLICSLDLAKRARAITGDKVLILFTDGGANVTSTSVNGPLQRRKIIETEVFRLGVQLRDAAIRIAVVDTQNQFRSKVDTDRLAEILGAQLLCFQAESDKLPIN